MGAAGYRVREQPKVVEAPLGVKEYWYDTFYRVVVIPEAATGCYLLSMDLYVPGWRGSGERLEVTYAGRRVALAYQRLEGLEYDGPGRLEGVELVVLEYDGGRELISARARLCGLRSPPSYADVGRLYERIRELTGFRPSRPRPPE